MKRTKRGAALLTAMLTLVLVATLSAGLAWQQWRSIEVERAERTRIAASWLMVGALDFARLILREDGRTGGADSLNEPWAVPLKESSLSSFLAADQNNNALLSDTEASNIFLSGNIIDLQSRLNAYNLVENGRIHANSYAAFEKLFDLLNLPQQELATLANNLRLSSDPNLDERQALAVHLMPQRLEQLGNLGLSANTLRSLKPFVTWLPGRSPVNVNTAPVEVLYASVPDMEMADARKIEAARNQKPFSNLAALVQLLPAWATVFSEGQHAIASRFFEVTGALRLVDEGHSNVLIERSVVQRDGIEVKTLWRERGGFPISTEGKSGQEILQGLR